jgi:CubicO group peptidase (beta-lactamase class C family)
MRDTIIALVISLLLCGVVAKPAAVEAQSAPAQPSDNYADKLRLVEQFVRTEMEKDKIPGLTIGFSQGNYTWVKGFGYADLENKLAAKPESAYRLASITKTFTGVAILQLVEKGKMSLDGEIQTYLPSYPKQTWPVTVRQLLVHTGGGQTGSGLGPEYVTPRQVVERIAKYPIQIEPGSRYLYTTSGYNLLGAAIEEVTGKPFGDYLRENVFDPVGMKDTRMNSEREMIPNRVRTYELVNGEIQNARFIDVSSRFGGGGTIGTVPDLLKWARGVDSKKILSEESIRLMYTPAATRGGRYVGPGGADWNDGDGYWYYTLGWLHFPINGQLAIWNDGAQIGTNTALLRVPSKDLAIAFACNLQEIGKMKYVKRLYELITDEPFVEPLSPSPVYAGGKTYAAVHKAINETFNYGSLHLERTGTPFTSDPRELASAFAYFNRATDLTGLKADHQAAAKAINDGRHPVGGDAFLKVGSWMAMKLREKNGAAAFKKYHTMGEIAFFADYVEMCRSNPQHPKDMRFATDFENLIMRWGRDWARTWDVGRRDAASHDHAGVRPHPPRREIEEGVSGRRRVS